MPQSLRGWVAHWACRSKPRSPSQLFTRTENSQTHTHKFHVGKKKKKRLTKLIAYALIFYESWVVKGVPTVQDLRVLADHCDAPQGQRKLVRENGRRLILDAFQHRAVAAVLRVAENYHVRFFLVLP